MSVGACGALSVRSPGEDWSIKMKHRTEWSRKVPRQGLLLHIGNDPALHRERALALEKQWNVISTTPEKAWQTFTENDCDLAVVCQSVPANERQKLVWQISQRSPSTPILVVTSAATGCNTAPAATVIDDPEQLIETVQHHLEEQRGQLLLRKA